MILIGILLIAISFIIYNYIWITDAKLLKTNSWYNERFSSALFWLSLAFLVTGTIICFMHSIWVCGVVVVIYFLVGPSVISPIICRIFPGAISSGKLQIWPIPKADRIIIYPKKALGPDSSLKEFPLLYLYFDDFSEITKVWQKGYLEAARHENDINSSRFSLQEIMTNENLFLDLYKKNLLRLKLNDGTLLKRDSEENYWDKVIHPEKYLDKLQFSSTLSDEKKQELLAEISRLEKEMNITIEAIKLRYDL